jgi:hypothetical protein
MLHREKERALFMEGCRRWETLLLAIFMKFGWKFRSCIEAWLFALFLCSFSGMNLIFPFLDIM